MCLARRTAFRIQKRSRCPAMPRNARFGRFVSISRLIETDQTDAKTCETEPAEPSGTSCRKSAETNPPQPHRRRANASADEDFRSVTPPRRRASYSLPVRRSAAIIGNCVAKFRIDSLAALARQLQFTPSEVRAQQLASAEELLSSIE